MNKPIERACGGDAELATKINNLHAVDAKLLAGQAMTIAKLVSSGPRDPRATKLLGILAATGKPVEGPAAVLFDDMVGC